MPKKDASLKVAANTPITASCNDIANLDRIDDILKVFFVQYHTFHDSNVPVEHNHII